MGTSHRWIAKGRGSHHSSNSLSTQLCSQECQQHPGLPALITSAPFGAAWEDQPQITSPEPGQPPSPSILDQPSLLPWGSNRLSFSPRLTKLVRPCDCPSRQQREKFSRTSGPLMEKVCLINNAEVPRLPETDDEQ